MEPTSNSVKFIRIGNALIAIDQIATIICAPNEFKLDIPGNFWNLHKQYFIDNYRFDRTQIINALDRKTKENAELPLFPEFIQINNSNEICEYIATKHIVLIWIDPSVLKPEYTIYFNPNATRHTSMSLAPCDLYTYLSARFKYDLGTCLIHDSATDRDRRDREQMMALTVLGAFGTLWIFSIILVCIKH